MNDYRFGNRLFEYRKKAGMSQSETARHIGVTNKAISSWENGKSKPSTEHLRKLADLWNVSVESLLSMKDERRSPEIIKIVITGGPCAGKTTAMTLISESHIFKDYRLLFVPETATELINGGVGPKTCASVAQFQTCLLELQLEKEKVFEKAAGTMDADKVLIICDRGALDCKAYMSQLDFAACLRNLNKSEVELRDNYDAVFHLVSAAKDAAEYYTTANNSARTETVEEAAYMDDRLISAWTGHPHLRIIDNSTDFETKINRLIAEIASFLGEPEPFEIERKYLIEYPDLNWLENEPNCERIEIIQTYLKSDNGDEVRVRQRGQNGDYVYFKTTKRNVSGLKRVEVERRLTEREYLDLLMSADPGKKAIRKTRYCLTFEGQYFEIDVYPEWDDKAIVEIELCNEDQKVHFPGKLKVIREVTDDEAYKNVNLATIRGGVS